MKVKIAGTLCLIITALVIGVFFLFWGIKGAVETGAVSRDYEITEGYLYDYEIYSKGEYSAAKRRSTNDTYRLIYHYYVDGQQYQISTDMGVGAVPERGTARDIYYDPDNPGEAILSGPGSNTFKIFFGLFFIAIPLFFIWILLPERKKEGRRPKKVSFNMLGVILGLTFMFFSYGCLFFITSAFSIRGIVNFYKTSFIFPMIIPLILFIGGGFLLIKSIFLNHKVIARICMVAGLSVLVIIIGFNLQNSSSNQTEKMISEKVDATVVNAILSERGFETADMPTTYWFIDESKLMYVVSGIRENTAFEFYEYSNGETTDGVYNRISYDISKELEPDEREAYENDLQNGGKIFSFNEDGKYSVVMYKDNIVIYAYSSQKQNEIQDILTELGYRSLHN
ncbi:Protein of uncharacterised function (DUF3592) [uncultured Roseburia sp.]|uniref:DUF3592 domain-containing protein n=1 Tax=Brotonthovivens ammoniilytica TaxID=2981725 RepID=A0ABT2TN13_9FIRM|nr:DUF3592 domain-containing protein [Brotonthovivens ammoniilytica]MCU6763181.1 DUF3592 domain-containing protein [Brotonthovivens ammoniilytica]SCJ05951.1 Protein of uncharacterised function (DUF3592) [uncultured Roseburia sp.]